MLPATKANKEVNFIHPSIAGWRFLFAALLFFFLLPHAHLQAESGGKISGVIKDAKTGQRLQGANVMVLNTVVGVSSSSDGSYVLPKLPAGTWTLRVNYIGYAPKDVEITIEASRDYTQDFSLDPSAVLFDQIVVTGSRQAENLSQAANSLNSIAQTDILERGHHLLTGALQEVPSVDLIGDNISIRGGSGYSFLSVGGSRVLMLIDDVPMLTSDFARANWDFLPVTELERVEILKGGGSVLYGSGGVSGVINLISRQPSKKPRISFRTTYGSYDDPSVPEWKWTDDTLNLHYYGADLSYSQSFGPLGLRLSVSRYSTTGYRQNSELDRWYFTARPVINFGDGSNLNLFFAYNREKRDLFFLWQSQNRALSTEYEDEAEVDGYLVSAIYNKVFSPKLLTKARFSLNSQLLGLPLSLTKGFSPALGISGELRSVWLPHTDHSITFGLDYRHDIAESDFFGKHIANTYSPYIQETWQLNDFLQVNAGARYDAYMLQGDTTESQLSPKFGMSIQPMENTIIHGSFGRGFRTPSVAERFTEHDLQDAAELLSNPELKPERVTLIDLGIRQRFSENLSIEVAGFYNTYDNLIELTQVSDINLILQFINCDKARVAGIETQASLKFLDDRINLVMNGTWMDTESVGGDEACRLADGESLPYRPKFSGYIMPSVKLGPVTLETEYRYLSRFDRVSFFLNEQRVAQKTWNVRARYNWRTFDVLFQVKNANNYNHTVVEQNIGEVRNFSISLIGEL